MNSEEAIPSLVDSHAHLDMEEFDPDREGVIRRAAEGHVAAILCPADLAQERSLRITMDMAASHRTIYAAAGLHPHQAKLLPTLSLDLIQDLAGAKKIVAIGEIGLDFHYDFSSPEEQRTAFRVQLAIAGELGLPVIIHSRNAGSEIALAVREEQLSAGGVLHCFTEDWDFAKAMLDMGFFISFSGIITFPKAHPLREVALKVPTDRLLVETDSPYLAPVPYRGKRNEPAYVVHAARLLAELKGRPLDHLAEAVEGNFHRAFRIPSA
jgi:TatD DNase family protein